MLSVLGLGLMVWFVSLCIRSARDVKRAKANRAEILRRIERLEENQEILAQNVLRNRSKIDRFDGRWTDYTRKTDAKMAKVAAAQLKFKHALEQAEEDINHLAYRMEELQEYAKYLETERDACVYGSANWHKWNNRVMANDNKVYNIQKQINKAEYTAKNAEIKLREVA